LTARAALKIIDVTANRWQPGSTIASSSPTPIQTPERCTANCSNLPPRQIAHATDARQALVVALTMPLSLTITETVLPFVDGYSLCEILRRQPATRRVPILVVPRR
jgi:CheY-like chemotaxis protein